MEFYADVTSHLKYEPIVKSGKLFLRIHYFDNDEFYKVLIATIDSTGDIQRQSPKTFKVFWDMGTLIALKLVKEHLK